MKRTTGILLVASMAVVAFLTPRGAQADLIGYDLGAANFPGFTGPYVHVDINRTSTTTATATFTSLSNSGITFLMLDGSSAALNVDASLFTVTSLSATQLPGFNVVTLSVADPPGTSQVDGWGRFNLTINSDDGYASASKSISFLITRTDAGSWATAADVLTENSSGYFAASHVGACTGNLSGTPCTKGAGALVTGFVSTPEPSGALLVGVGCLIAGAAIRRRR